MDLPSDDRICIIENIIPQGFGANHNQAFNFCTADLFCIINPDISFQENPFPRLIMSTAVSRAGLVAPVVKNLDGIIEDSVRKFPSPFSIFRRRFFGYQDNYVFLEGAPDFCPDWVGGMFMLFHASAYDEIKGFDERYFLYVEDVDICTRLWKAGYRVVLCPSVAIFHDARRESHKSWQHLRWHFYSLSRYFFKHFWRHPATLKLIQR
jgi:GT2 family glycosyltransferase